MLHFLRNRVMVCSIGLTLTLVTALRATGFYQQREMSCSPGGVAPKATNNNSNFFDYIMECWPSNTDCSSKKLRVFMSADTIGADEASWVNFEVFWDDGTSSSDTLEYPDDTGGTYAYATSFQHEYAQNGTYHPTVVIETALRTCTYASETVVTP